MSTENGLRNNFIKRSLWYQPKEEKKYLTQDQLIEKTSPLVILGEAGIGKTELLRKLSEFDDQLAYCTARTLVNRTNPKTILKQASTLVIDALDELSSRKDGDAIDLVLEKLGQLNYPRFILSSREADWQNAISVESLSEQYERMPLVLHLEPFSELEAQEFLLSNVGIERAVDIVGHFKTKGLENLLGNPHTLELIAEVAESGDLPNTLSELYEQVVEILSFKHKRRNENNPPTQEEALMTAGAAFASLILTGNEAITPNTYPEEGELNLTEVSQLTGCTALAYMAGTRLFAALGKDRFTYRHRRIGEYLGAQWLAKNANNQRKRRRILALFHSNEVVPSNLRGIHAWLAHDSHLATAVINADPLGVIEYGDGDVLTPNQAKHLIDALGKLSESNPNFRGWWKRYSIRGITHTALENELRQLIINSETPYQLRSLVLEAITDAKIAASFQTELQAISEDPHTLFTIRSSAIEALVTLPQPHDWTALLQKLHSHGNADSIRLAIELLGDIDCNDIDEYLLVDLVAAWAKLNSRTIGVIDGLENNLPENKIEPILDRLSMIAKEMGKPHSRPGDTVLTDFAYHLAARLITQKDIDAIQLWHWLEPFDLSVGYGKESRQKLAAYVQQNHSFRQTIQEYVLLDQTTERSIWGKQWLLDRHIPGCRVTPTDIIVLLKTLNPNNLDDKRWKDIVQLIHHDEIKGAEVRAAAQPFAQYSIDDLQ